MNKYANGKIYKIICNTTNDVYYGSTTQKLYKRINDHKKSYRCYLIDKFHYLSSFEIIKNNNFDIVLVENCICENKEQLEAKERFYIDNNKCVNKYKPTRSHAEYYQDHKERLQENQKENYNDKKDTINDIAREKYKNITKEQKEIRNQKAKENYHKRKANTKQD